MGNVSAGHQSEAQKICTVCGKQSAPTAGQNLQQTFVRYTRATSHPATACYSKLGCLVSRHVSHLVGRNQGRVRPLSHAAGAKTVTMSMASTLVIPRQNSTHVTHRFIQGHDMRIRCVETAVTSWQAAPAPHLFKALVHEREFIYSPPRLESINVRKALVTKGARLMRCQTEQN